MTTISFHRPWYSGLISWLTSYRTHHTLMRWLRNRIAFQACIPDDVIKWKHFPRYWPFVREIHRSPVNSPQKGQWRGALVFSLICTRINGWVNNGEAGDLRRYRAHYDVTVMFRIQWTVQRDLASSAERLPTGWDSCAGLVPCDRPVHLCARRSEPGRDLWQDVPGPYFAYTHHHDSRPSQGSPRHLPQNHLFPLRRCYLRPSGSGGHGVAREPYRRQPLYGMVWWVSHPDLPVWDHHLAQIRGWHYGGAVWQPTRRLHSSHQLHPSGDPVHTGRGMWLEHSHARRWYSPIPHWPTEFQRIP